MAMQETKIGVNNVKVKLVVDKTANRVLFAEAGKDFVDFLFQIQELPLGVVSKWVRSVSENSICCVSNIRDSIENLPDNYFISRQKSALLDPEVRNCGLKLRVPLERCRENISFTVWGRLATPSDKEVVAYLDGEGGYVKGLATFMVMDDLTVKPMQLDLCFNLLKEYNIGRIGDIQEKVVSVGVDEAKKLLEAALRSKTALTDTFLPPQETTRHRYVVSDYVRHN